MGISDTTIAEIVENIRTSFEMEKLMYKCLQEIL